MGGRETTGTRPFDPEEQESSPTEITFKSSLSRQCTPKEGNGRA